jgi:hypothetical protein
MRISKEQPGGLASWIVCGAALCAHGLANAYEYNPLDGSGNWHLLMSPYMGHFRYSPEHRRVYAIGGERLRDNGALGGAAYFSNSFGQPSAYVYAGRRYFGLLGIPQWTGQWTAGLLYGYKGEYAHKVPLNHKGFAPGAVVSTGWQFSKSLSTEVHLLGDAGLMLQFSYRLE